MKIFRNNMNVLMIHQAFTTMAEPGGTRHFELASYCKRWGIQFTIVTSDLTYLTGMPAVKSRKLYVEQHVSGLRLLRAKTLPTIHKSFVWRVFSFMSFMASTMHNVCPGRTLLPTSTNGSASGVGAR